jgi:hypothetical protein
VKEFSNALSEISSEEQRSEDSTWIKELLVSTPLPYPPIRLHGVMLGQAFINMKNSVF